MVKWLFGSSFAFSAPSWPEVRVKNSAQLHMQPASCKGLWPQRGRQHSQPTSHTFHRPHTIFRLWWIPLADKRTGYHYIDELPKGKPGSKCANCICASIITTSRRSVKIIALISHRTFIGARCSFAPGVTRDGTPRGRPKHLSYKKINQGRTKPINNEVQSYVFLTENCFRGWNHYQSIRLLS